MIAVEPVATEKAAHDPRSRTAATMTNNEQTAFGRYAHDLS
jgi:hypothetical protein